MLVKLASVLCVAAAVTGIAVPVQPPIELRTGPVTFQPSPFNLNLQRAPTHFVQPAPLPIRRPITVQHVKEVLEEEEEPVSYEYEYAVQDPNTGDTKQHRETRNGDTLHGFYSVVQPDGLKRIVEYTSSKGQGFNAVVRFESVPVYGTQPQVSAHITSQPQPAVSSAPAPQLAYVKTPQVTYQPTAVAYAPASPTPRVAFTEQPPAPAPVAYAQIPAQVIYQRVPYTYAQQAQLFAQARAAAHQKRGINYVYRN